MQQIVSINVLGITGHINFNVKILETFAMEIIMKYSKEIKIGKIFHATRLNIGCVSDMYAWELSVHRLVCSCLLFLFKWPLTPETNQQEVKTSYFLCPTHS